MTEISQCMLNKSGQCVIGQLLLMIIFYLRYCQIIFIYYAARCWYVCMCMCVCGGGGGMLYSNILYS